MGARFTGGAGLLRFKYYDAALLRSWDLERQEEVLGSQWILTAKARQIDTYWIEKSPLSLHLCMGPTWWTWENVVLLDEPTLGRVVCLVESDPTILIGGMEWDESIGL